MSYRRSRLGVSTGTLAASMVCAAVLLGTALPTIGGSPPESLRLGGIHTSGWVTPAEAGERMAPWSHFGRGGPDLGPHGPGALRTSVISGTTWNWAGYVYCPAWNGTGCPEPDSISQVVGVQGSWVVPSITNTTIGVPEADATWVGIGGAGTSDLVQAGVDGAVEDGLPAYAAFWEMAPAASSPVVLSPVHAVTAGDQVYVDIQLLGTLADGYQNWSFFVRDNTTDSQWNGTEICGAGCAPSNLSSADWIQESPYLGPYLLQLPAFTSAHLDGARFLSRAGTWTVLTNLTGPLLDVSLLDPHYSLSVLGLVSPVLTPGGFWFEYLVDAEGPAESGRAVVSSSGVPEPGQPLAATLNLSSPDSFSSTPATSLALAIALENSTNVTCYVVPSGFAPLNISVGNGSYGVRGPICPGIANGIYASAVTLWYVPLGGEAGGNGSLELYSGGFSNGTLLLLDGPEVARLAVAPASGQLDVGQTVSLSVLPFGGTPPYTMKWEGLPAGCPANASFNVNCTITQAGAAFVEAVVTDSVGSVVDSRMVDLEVFPDPVVSIVLAGGTPLQGASVEFGSIVTGGAPPFQYVWKGLPPGCASGNGSFVCTPSSAGSYRLGLTVLDANGFASEANATLTVDPSVVGLSVWTFATVVALGGAVALLAVVALRGRRPPREPEAAGDLPGSSLPPG